MYFSNVCILWNEHCTIINKEQRDFPYPKGIWFTNSPAINGRPREQHMYADVVNDELP